MMDGFQSREQLEKWELEQLQPYALRSAVRRNDLDKSFREHLESSPLEYRTEYHRDRDRIVWSTAFRRLQHKTQIFPHYVEDHYRRRLTHSLEVAQISTTICRALQINDVAGEAISLAHDIGHTPFGHGGEEALNKVLSGTVEQKEILSTPVAVYGYDHCMQGVEQVSRVCHDYHPSFYGLNLSFDIRDGILKHIFNQSAQDAQRNGRPFSCLSNIVKLSEYKQYRDNFGSLEAQCVWLADKFAYFLSDIEDALRARIFTFQAIQKTEFAQKLWEKYQIIRKDKKNLNINSMDDFMSFKRNALTVLILDCVNATSKRLIDLAPKAVDDILGHPDRLVDVDANIRTAWDAFYRECVEGKLYRHESVKACEFKASKIIRDLFEAYTGAEDLIPFSFREHTHLAYENMLSEDQVKIMAIRNYLAGMTDSFATEQHKRLFMSSEHANTF